MPNIIIIMPNIIITTTTTTTILILIIIIVVVIIIIMIGVSRLLGVVLEGSLGNKALQEIHLFGNAEVIEPRTIREIQKYLRTNRMATRTRMALLKKLSPPTSRSAPSAISQQEDDNSTSSFEVSSVPGQLKRRSKRLSLPAGERVRKLEEELSAMSVEMRKSKEEEKALKDLNEMLKQKITVLVSNHPQSASSSPVISNSSVRDNSSKGGLKVSVCADVHATERAFVSSSLITHSFFSHHQLLRSTKHSAVCREWSRPA